VLSGTAASRSAQLSWTVPADNVGVTGYHVYRGGALLATTAATSYTVKGLKSGQSYTFTVDAYDAAGNVSTVSNTAAATTLPPDTTPPSPPTGLAAAVASPTRVDLTWTASTDNVGVAGYSVYRNGALVGSSVTNAYVDTGLQPATSYSYYTIAYDAAGNSSAASNNATATTRHHSK